MSDVLGVCQGILVAACVGTVAGFWLLFFLVVKVRLADTQVRVEDEGWRFLWERWPVAEIKAYATLLRPDERRRWYNLWLLHARTGLTIMLCALIVLMLFSALPA